MKEENFDRERLLELSAKCCDESVTSSEFAELERILGESSGARAAFRDYTNVHVTLANCYGAAGSAEAPGKVFEISEAAVVRAWPRAVLAAAAVLALGLGAYFLMPGEEAGGGGPTVQGGRDTRQGPAMSLVEPESSQAVVSTPLIRREESTPVKAEVKRPQSPPQAGRVPPGPGLIARVESLSGVTWAENSEQPGVHDWVGASMLTFEKGLIRIVFLDGASVTLRGPARMDLLSGNAARLESGTLVARVPQSAVGFTVRTDSVDVVDLGTAFGMSATSGGEVEIQVFQGEVELVSPVDAPGAMAKPKRIHKGQGYRAKVSARPGGAARKKVTLEAVKADEAPYQRMVSYNSGVLKTSGPVRFVAGEPNQVIGNYEHNKNLFVFRERAVWLDTPLEVDVVAPGNYRADHGQAIATAAGVAVRSYLLHFNPVGQSENEGKPGRSVKASVTFDEPVVGIIFGNEHLKATDASFATDLSKYRMVGRSMDRPTEEALANAKTGKTGASAGDRVILSGDRKTVRVDWKASTGMDEVRVLVRDEG